MFILRMSDSLEGGQTFAVSPEGDSWPFFGVWYVGGCGFVGGQSGGGALILLENNFDLLVLCEGRVCFFGRSGQEVPNLKKRPESRDFRIEVSSLSSRELLSDVLVSDVPARAAQAERLASGFMRRRTWGF